MKARALLLLLAACGGAQAEGQWQAALSSTRDQLSNGGSDWTEHSLSLRRVNGRHLNAGLELSQTERFGLRDQRVAADGSLQVLPELSFTGEAAYSSSHHVLARDMLGGGLLWEAAHGWLLQAAVRTSGYANVRVNQFTLGAERYTGDFSHALLLRSAHAYGSAAHSAEWRSNWYYSDTDAVSLSLAAGQEASQLGSRVLLTSSRTLAVTGHHSLDAHWTLQYGLARTRQPDLYNRTSISLGLRTAF
ncbi:YaiO family outer membrane beta-barrel protein [Massilia sp. TS11]|uniref:YaiO family outer membrane beta-barrel protein n=1 Tax=Massilia sp. TS11 TaxID=2908003 RepID=UPI001EDBEEE6|nr:YaiO family outer membrane beta-barrel protein [Massilia sp. TS11]MCG2583962.1 YaiO family outer membrane beta-barrel protein [Massilia sp. TS11]